MTTHEQILAEARRRWKCNTDTENLINEVKLLLGEIEDYRNLIIKIEMDITTTLENLRTKGGE